MMARVHYHTDCPWFAGCENMLANLLNDRDLRRQYQVSLSYRDSPSYSAGLASRTLLDFPLFPLRFPEPSSALPAPAWLPMPIRRVVRFASRQLATYPLLAYEVWLLRRLFRSLAPDVLHINNGGYPAALSARAAAIAARLARVPHVVMVVNNLAEPHGGPSYTLRPAVDRRVVRAVSRFVTGSSAAAAQLGRVLRLDQAAVAYPNGIALRPTTETRDETLVRLGLGEPDGVLFGVVALMEVRKGHRILLEAVAALVKGPARVGAFTVLLEGDGPLRPELERYVAEQGIERHVRFVGSERNVMNLMAAIDVLVLPSVAHEDFPNVTLEAMAHGKPVIASRLAGTPEQVEEGVTGLLVTPAEAPVLAAAMARLLASASLRQKMGRAGRRRFEDRFTAPVAVRRYAELYQSLIAEHQ